MIKINFVQKLILVIVGILLGAVLLEAGLRIGGLTVITSRKFVNWILQQRHNEYRILCLGESTTYDGGIYCYPSQLETILNNQKKGIKFKVINNGIPGINSESIVEHLESTLKQYNPDMVITMIGINDDPADKLKGFINNNRSNSFFKELRINKLFNYLKLNIMDGLEKSRKISILKKEDVIEDLKAEEKILMLEKELESDYSNDFAVFALLTYYKNQGRIEEIEQMYKRLINMSKTYNDRIKFYVDLARFYQTQKRFREIEKMYKEAIEKSPDFFRLYCELAIHYRDQGRFLEAERLYKIAIQIEPKNSIIYDNLGDCYKKQSKQEDAEMMYKKARELHIKHLNTSLEGLGREARLSGRYDSGERIYKKILKIDPNDTFAYLQLANIYEKQNKITAAEEMYKNDVWLKRDYYLHYAILALFYQKQGQVKLAGEYFKKRDQIELPVEYPASVVRNYLKLKELVIKRGSRLVCVQYPLRNVGVLKRIFGSEKSIIFVDNEKIFKNAIEEHGYAAYFIDSFAGDFGHCTREGNRLLADNISTVLLKECFNK
jgi:tetratricopeptide (TPR) repeat protein